MKIKTGTIIGFLGISILLGAVRTQKTHSAVVDAITKIVKNYPGYQIVHCSAINIIDELKAYKFAFDSGMNFELSEMDDKLFGSGKCFISLNYNSITAKFVYNLITSFLAGSVNSNKIKIENATKLLNDLKEDFKNSNFNTETWIQNPQEHILILIEKFK